MNKPVGEAKWSAFHAWNGTLCAAFVLAVVVVAQTKPSASYPIFKQPPANFKTDATMVSFSGVGKPGTAVELYEGENFLGQSASDMKNGAWKLDIYLEPGKHKIRARYASDDGDPGPWSPTLEVLVLDALKKLEIDKLKILGISDGAELPAGLTEIKGQCKPGARVILNVSGRDYKKTADEDGLFSFNLKLVPGKTRIKVSTIEPADSQELNLTVVDK